MSIKAVIFDMDGVLVESEVRNDKAKLEVLSRFGVSFDYDYYSQFPGNSNLYVWNKIKSDFGITEDTKKLDALDSEARRTLIKKEGHIAVCGAVELVRRTAQKFPIALASGSPMWIIEDAMKSVGLYELFSARISGEDMKRCKPYPDIFLAAAKALGVKSDECAVIEDSANGVAAAKAAGMFCVGFVNENSGHQDLSSADMIINKLNMLDFSTLN